MAWLFPILGRVCSAAVWVFYRFTAAGERVSGGPVLLVANHPNSLLDAIVVVAAAGRPVRFLAKATLFEERAIGALLRAGRAIPVYRRQDDPALMDRNATVFEAVHEALGAGDAVGIFPEGLTHSEPSLARLRTGAARISLGAAERKGITFPIVPVGILQREKERFRSKTLALIGAPVPWADLAGRPEGDVEAVRELTRRIEEGLRDVTFNVDHLEDRRTVECAEAIYSAEMRLDRSAELRVRRLRQVSETVSRLRREDPERVEGLYDSVEQFSWTLDVLGIRAQDLDRSIPTRSTVGWALKVFGLLLFGGPIAAVGHLLFFVPYRLTHWLATRPQIYRERQSTWKLLGGFVVYVAWFFLLSVAAWWRFGVAGAVTAAIGLPVLAVLTQLVRERWSGAWAQAHRYRLLRRSGKVRERLLERRRKLARELERLRREIRAGETLQS